MVGHDAAVVGQDAIPQANPSAVSVLHISSAALQVPGSETLVSVDNNTTATASRLDASSGALGENMAPASMHSRVGLLESAANPKKRHWCDPVAEQVESFQKVIQSGVVTAAVRSEKYVSVSSKSKPSPSLESDFPKHVEFQAMDAPTPVRRGRPKKSSTPVVNLTPRMKTRSQSNLQGFKAKPVLGVEVKRHKKCSKVTNALKEVVIPVSPVRMKGNASKENVAKTPPVPMPMLQNIGGILGIDPRDLTVEKLTAPHANDASPPAVNNDD
jgi:hypothetical protein